MEKSATQMLEEEHHLIQKVVGSMAALADMVYTDQVVEEDILTNLVEFMRVFVGRCHFAKEENQLFPLLVKKGVPMAGCPIGVLADEHQQSRKLIADLGAAVEAYLKDAPKMKHFLTTTLHGFVELYPKHIWKENYLLFPMTDKILDHQEQLELVTKFKMVEGEIGVDMHQRFEELAENLIHKAQHA